MPGHSFGTSGGSQTFRVGTANHSLSAIAPHNCGDRLCGAAPSVVFGDR
ncbi:hypothetical protein [Nodosilinea sp. E11]|nr:hypothetical protein [Nodosilinea sp. E11]WOD41322.1 hypothetical protein RRF56_11005 [Nodosilinea sp. E11]